MLGERILRFGEKFINRLDSAVLDSALDYINYNEEWLAFDILCTQLSEYEVPISKEEAEEADEAEKIALDMGLSTNNPPFKYLRELIKSVD